VICHEVLPHDSLGHTDTLNIKIVCGKEQVGSEIVIESNARIGLQLSTSMWSMSTLHPTDSLTEIRSETIR
jgi:hypothetical protein